MPRLSWPRHFITRRKETLPLQTRSLREEEGATLVETALALTVLFVLMFGIFEFAMAFFTYHYISEAAREGARWAIVRGSESCGNTPNLTYACPSGASETDIANYVKSLGYPGIDSTNMKVTVDTSQYDASTQTWTSCGELTAASMSASPPTSCNSPAVLGSPYGDSVQVTVDYNFPLSIPFWGTKTIKIGSTSSMVYSQ